MNRNSSMTVGELREALEDLDDEMEVRLAMQRSWAFEYSIGSVAVANLDAEEVPKWDDGTRTGDENEICYLVEGTQIGYLPEIAAEYIGWK